MKCCCQKHSIVTPAYLIDGCSCLPILVCIVPFDSASCFFWSDRCNTETILWLLEMSYELSPVENGPNKQAIYASWSNQPVFWVKSEALDTARLSVSCYLGLKGTLIQIPNFDHAVFTAGSKKSACSINWITPLNLVDSAFEILEDKLGLWLLSFPETNPVLWAAACKDFATGIPLNLLDFVLMSFRPNLLRTRWLIDVPEVDLFALSSNSQSPVVFPVDFDSNQRLI